MSEPLRFFPTKGPYTFTRVSPTLMLADPISHEDEVVLDQPPTCDCGTAELIRVMEFIADTISRQIWTREVQAAEREEREPPRWLSVQEVAKKLGVTAETVRTWIQIKKLKATRPSGRPRGRLRVAARELNRFLAQDEEPGTSGRRPDPRNVASKILGSMNPS